MKISLLAPRSEEKSRIFVFLISKNKEFKSPTTSSINYTYIHNGSETNQQGTPRFGSRPPSTVLCRTSRRWSFSLASNHYGATRESLSGRCVLPDHPLSHRLPLQAAKGSLHHPNLSPQHQLKWIHLLRHPQIAVVASSHNLKRYNFFSFRTYFPGAGSLNLSFYMRHCRTRMSCNVCSNFRRVILLINFENKFYPPNQESWFHTALCVIKDLKEFQFPIVYQLVY